MGKKNEKQFVVMIGNFKNGFKFYGPFTYDEADCWLNDYASKAKMSFNFEVIKLES